MIPRRVAAIPAFQAADTIKDIVQELQGGFDEVWVIDDGSSDTTAEQAAEAGARVVAHPRNQGKGAALRTALHLALQEHVDALVTLDADGQHPACEAIRLDRSVDDRSTLVLGVRDLIGAGAPRANLCANRISNWWVHRLSGYRFADTQCGLRRYPVYATLDLGIGGERFAFEGEAVLRSALCGLKIVEVPIHCYYPKTRKTHFHIVKDPCRITMSFAAATLEHKGCSSVGSLPHLRWALPSAPYKSGGAFGNRSILGGTQV